MADNSFKYEPELTSKLDNFGKNDKFTRSSRDENVQVRIKYTTDSNMWHLIHGSGGVVTMTRAEYKKLMNDSLKGRTALVRAKFGVSSSFKITGVDNHWCNCKL